MSPTATADIARVMLRILIEGCQPGIYHVVNSGAASWFEFARAYRPLHRDRRLSGTVHHRRISDSRRASAL